VYIEVDLQRSHRFIPTNELRCYHHCFNDISIILRIRFNKESYRNLLKWLQDYLQLLSLDIRQRFFSMDLERTLIEPQFHGVAGNIGEAYGLLCALGLQSHFD
jgi:hypothetical protein